MRTVSVKNLRSPRTGEPVANQIEVTMANGDRYFQSFDTMIAKITKAGKVYLDKIAWEYSPTTSTYRNIFLGEDSATTRKKIADGEYKLVSLN